MRRVLRPALVCIAIVFLIEAWLWDRLEPVVAAIVEVIPLKRLKVALVPWTPAAQYFVDLLLPQTS
jgi:hypothetical protein